MLMGKPITNSTIINEIKRLNFDSNDVRASWKGAGIPIYDNCKLAKWAHEHLSMYLGFIYKDLKNKIDNKLVILDVGCGSGHSSVTIAALFKHSKIIAIDNNRNCINFAKKYNSADNLEFIHGDAITHKYNTKFDFVFCLEIFEHIVPKFHNNFMSNNLNSLKDNGRLFFTTPNNMINEPDSNHGHVGMLNQNRAKLFFHKYKNNIIDESYYNNKKLTSLNIDDFIINMSKEKHMDLKKNLSHFRFVMKK